MSTPHNNTYVKLTVLYWLSDETILGVNPGEGDGCCGDHHGILLIDHP
ncbi:Putative phage protein [Xenorhabdus bovienii]|uniref:Putative phage protein n=1 Tax=Xenorhabdus bovienii TaxID=40576 RepID=A0A0B6XGP8_XENBV|nr:Putative phage protein [Xenorhabdus bovienii]